MEGGGGRTMTETIISLAAIRLTRLTRTTRLIFCNGPIAGLARELTRELTAKPAGVNVERLKSGFSSSSRM